MSDFNVQIIGIKLLRELMSHFKMTARAAIQSCLDKNQLSQDQRQQRMNIRNGFLIEDVTTIRSAMDRHDEFGKLCLQEMIDTCEEQNVTNFGKTH